MIHIYKEGKKESPIFVLLHGTGGDENDLIPLAQVLDPNATILSIRGEVYENGMNRFFKRKAEGVYDVEDLHQRGENLYNFIVKMSQEKDFDLEKVAYIGFSNGSNIAINMLLREDSSIKRALLFAPMYPVDISENHKDMTDYSVYLSMGKNDPIARMDDSQEVIKLFQDRKAQVEEFWVNGHELNQATVVKAQEWLAKNF